MAAAALLGTASLDLRGPGSKMAAASGSCREGGGFTEPAQSRHCEACSALRQIGDLTECCANCQITDLWCPPLGQRRVDVFHFVILVSEDNHVYDTLGDLHQDLSCGDYRCEIWFTSHSDLTVGEYDIQKLLPILLLSADRNTGCGECQIFDGPNSYNIKIPLSTKGQFCKCENKESYTLEQILQDPALSKSNFTCKNIGTGVYKTLS
ncbi:unnamed protein product [Ranitomeya imitator]|uniref:CABIT domain-containing protein n=1 Tax=Ranitomeya imitator TaxID=111125 RepID=A0ABN9LM90_9NEOB|nr:unnamed protein product [Ranitomeya imitator]